MHRQKGCNIVGNENYKRAVFSKSRMYFQHFNDCVHTFIHNVLHFNGESLLFILGVGMKFKTKERAL